MLKTIERTTSIFSQTVRDGAGKRPASFQFAQAAKHDRARDESGEEGDGGRDQGEAKVGERTKREGAEQRRDLGAAGSALRPSREAGGDEEEGDRRPAADGRPLKAESLEMTVELVGDEPVGSANEMQDVDDLAVFGDRAARRKTERHGHRHEDEDEERDAERNDRPCHDADARRPNAVIVEVGLGACAFRRSRSAATSASSRPLMRTTTMRGTGRSERSRLSPSHG